MKLRLILFALMVALAWGAGSVARAEAVAPGNSSEALPAVDVKKGDVKQGDAKKEMKPPVMEEADEQDDEGEGEVKETQLLALALRLDAAFSAGGPIVQGFSLPGARLSASGDVSEFLDYRFTLGQTREFSTVLLPQMMPVEGFVELHSSGTKGDVPPLSWRFGMFRPSFSPTWTPDLAELNLPDYGLLDQAVFLNNDIGTELTYRAQSDRFQATLGTFNGNGTFSLNTNDSKAFNVYLRQLIPFGKSSLTVGTGSYFLIQSSLGSINYKNNWVTSLFGSAYVDSLRLTLTAELLASQFEDSTRVTSPFGVATYATLGITDWGSLFARYEYGQSLPDGTAGLRHAQIGPLLELDRAVRVFFLYDYLLDSGGPENSVFLRVRLAI